MKTFVLALGALIASPLAAAADVTTEDIRKLVAAGVSDEVIVTFIRSNGPVQKMSADDVVLLKVSGASERVLGALMEPAKPAPAPAPTTTVREVPQTTSYVYSSPAYTPAYYGGYYYGYPPYTGYPYAYGGYGSPYYARPYYPYYRPYYGGSVALGYRYGGYCGSSLSVGIGFGW